MIFARLSGGKTDFTGTGQYTNEMGKLRVHAKVSVISGNGGKIINAIMDAGFEISAMQMYTMEKANAEEFYEVYKGVVQEYNSMVNELTSGASIALEIRAQNAPVAFREMTGPADPVSGTVDW